MCTSGERFTGQHEKTCPSCGHREAEWAQLVTGGVLSFSSFQFHCLFLTESAPESRHKGPGQRPSVPCWVWSGNTALATVPEGWLTYRQEDLPFSLLEGRLPEDGRWQLLIQGIDLLQSVCSSCRKTLHHWLTRKQRRLIVPGWDGVRHGWSLQVL